MEKIELTEKQQEILSTIGAETKTEVLKIFSKYADDLELSLTPEMTGDVLMMVAIDLYLDNCKKVIAEGGKINFLKTRENIKNASSYYFDILLSLRKGLKNND